MKAAMAEEMRRLDEQATQDYGIPGIVLMENAGVAVAREIETITGGVSDKKICIFAGKGKNGGDGFAAARHLSNRGAKVKVFLLAARDAVQGDAAMQMDILARMGVDVVEVTGIRDWDKVKIGVAFADCLVDALLGTGYGREITGAMAQAVELINHAGKTVVAVDIPSGVQPDTGQIGACAVRADYTVTFGLPKPGLLLYPGAAYAGKWTVADSGLPAVLLAAPELKQALLTQRDISRCLPERRPDAHKGDCGRVWAVAGSTGLTGAAALCAEAAMRTGAGLVTLGIAASLNSIMEVKLTEVMTRPLPEAAAGAIGFAAWGVIEHEAAASQVLAVGPGLGRQAETLALVREIIEKSQVPLVLDADALYALQDHTGLLGKAKHMPVLTPHAGEMARLTGLTVADINENRLDVARMAANEWQAIIVLKGAPTLIALPGGELFINTTGNAGMATAGSGDVLTGVIAGLLAQGLSGRDAALCGVYLHGLAGDLAAGNKLTGLLAGDMLNMLPSARAQLIACPQYDG